MRTHCARSAHAVQTLSRGRTLDWWKYKKKIEVLLRVCWLHEVLLLVYFKFLAWEALHCTLYHAEQLVFCSFSREC